MIGQVSNFVIGNLVQEVDDDSPWHGVDLSPRTFDFDLLFVRSADCVSVVVQVKGFFLNDVEAEEIIFSSLLDVVHFKHG